jgi:spermidine/putrescine transport system permease protein
MTTIAGRLSRGLLGAYFWALVVFLYIPILVLVVFSFNDSTIAALPLSGFTTHWYDEAFANGELTESIRRSALIALVNGVLATLLGVLAALGLAAPRLRLRAGVTALVMLPLVVPYVVLGIGLLIFLKEMGFEQAIWAVVFGHVVISIPYSVLVILPRLRTLDPSIAEAARDLGANEVSGFVRVTLPLIIPAVVSSALIAFIISFDEYAIASFLVPPGERTFPLFLYSGAKTPDLRPQMVAIAAVVIVLSLLAVLAMEFGRRWAERRLAGAE